MIVFVQVSLALLHLVLTAHALNGAHGRLHGLDAESTHSDLLIDNHIAFLLGLLLFLCHRKVTAKGSHRRYFLALTLSEHTGKRRD